MLDAHLGMQEGPTTQNPCSTDAQPRAPSPNPNINAKLVTDSLPSAGGLIRNRKQAPNQRTGPANIMRYPSHALSPAIDFFASASKIPTANISS